MVSCARGRRARVGKFFQETTRLHHILGLLPNKCGFMGQLDRATQAITDQMAELQRQQRSIAARFRELNNERVKFETLAARAREQLKQTNARIEQKEADMLSAQRYLAKTRSNRGN